MEVLLLLLVMLLVFGPKRLPEMGRSLGHGIREFKDSVTGNEIRDDEPQKVELVPPTPAPQPVATTPAPPAATPPVPPPAADPAPPAQDASAQPESERVSG